jgi:two-component system, NarL family, sensor kinase
MWRFLKNPFGRKVKRSRSQLELQLLERTAALEELTKRLLKVQDDERRRVARDLHDSTGQTLTALKIAIYTLQTKPETTESVKKYLSEISDLADQALQEIRTTSYLLHPPLLDVAGFSSAAQWYVEGFAKRSGLKIKMHFAREYERMPDHIEIALFRVLQESLTNVHRHSGANEVNVRFRRDSQGAVLEVRDFGRGLPKDVNPYGAPGRSSGVGLTGIRELLNDMKGELELERAVPGTILRATIPLFT